MTITREDIAAFADGELSGERETEVAAAVTGDAELAQQVQRHRALKAMLAEHYAPVLGQCAPERLTSLLAQPQPAEIVDFAAARERRESRRRLPHWGWIAAPALAASLVLAVFLPRQGGEASPYVDTQLAAVLDDRLVAVQSPREETRAGSGIACRDETGWKLEALGKGSHGDPTDYRMAGAGDAEILALAQEMAAGPALDEEAEKAARARDWR